MLICVPGSTKAAVIAARAVDCVPLLVAFDEKTPVRKLASDMETVVFIEVPSGAFPTREMFGVNTFCIAELD